MPKPRKPHPKPRPGGSRSSRRDAKEAAWLEKKLTERFVRFAELLAQRRQMDGDYRLITIKEKAPGLSTGGSSSSED